MIEVGPLDGVIDIEEIPDGRFRPGERGPDLLRIGFPDRHRPDIHGRKRRLGRVRVAQQSPCGQGLGRQEMFFPERDLDLDELRSPVTTDW